HSPPDPATVTPVPNPRRRAMALPRPPSRPYAADLSDLFGPESDVPAPDVNTNEQTMAWFVDTYSMHERRTEYAVVTGKPLEVGGSAGRREATGRGVLFCVREACAHLKLPLPGASAAIQGFGN